MKLNEILTEATFTPKNFPREGNEKFSGSGERTNYISHEINDTTGFKVIKDSKILKPDGTRIDVKQGQKIYITKPGKLFRGEEIGAANKSGVYTQVSLTSPNKNDFLGYLQLSSIEKPSGKTQSRVQSGSEAQEKIFDFISNIVGNENVKLVSTAKKGSTLADLVVDVKNNTIQIEVKGTQSDTAPITFFDKSARRNQSNEILDKFAKIFSKNKYKSFTELVDSYRKNDPTIGFPGDEGVGKSGKLPSAFNVSDSETLKQLKQILLDHFAENNDNYFAIYNSSNKQVKMFYTGHGKNVLKLPLLPDLKSFSVKTYGGPSGGAMRVGIKVKL